MKSKKLSASKESWIDLCETTNKLLENYISPTTELWTVEYVDGEGKIKKITQAAFQGSTAHDVKSMMKMTCDIIKKIDPCRGQQRQIKRFISVKKKQ